MKKMKKFLAMLLAMAMVLGMSVTTFAAEATTPGDGTKNDRGTITVEGVAKDTGVTVTAYQIIKADYNLAGGYFSGYTALYNDDVAKEEDKIAIDSDNISVSEAQLTAILNYLRGTDEEADSTIKNAKADTTYPMTGSNGTYTATVPVGTYLIVVSGAESVIYSPLVVSAYYDANNVIQNGDYTITNTTGRIKVSFQPELDKTVTSVTHEGVSQTGDALNGTVNVGDVVTYEVEIKPIPYYGGDYPVFNVTDTLTGGLEFTGNVTFKLNGTETHEFDSLIPAGLKDSKELTLNFVSTVSEDHPNGYLLNSYQGQTLVISYTATVTDAALMNSAANENNAELTFSRDSNVNGRTDTVDDQTYNYTFDLSGAITGSDENSVLTKVGREVGATTTSALENAVFGLYTDQACTTLYKNTFYTGTVELDGKEVVGTTYSDGDGKLMLKGLAAGTYYLKETQAPTGYSLSGEVHKIEITTTLYEDGQLKTWDIKVNTIGKNQPTSVAGGSVSFDGGNRSVNGITPGEVVIENTQLAELPSTGGIGTTIFTIGGCAIMIIAAGLYFSLRRKSAK